MPFNLYFKAAILLLGMGIGSGITYKVMHSQIVSMELKIANQKVEAANILAVETQKVASAEEAQRNLNLELDKSHEAYINTSNIYSTKLNSAIDQLRFAKRGKNSSSSATKNSNPTIDTKDGEDFTTVSRKLLQYLATESKRADESAIDKNTLLDFVKRDNCGIPK